MTASTYFRAGNKLWLAVLPSGCCNQEKSQFQSADKSVKSGDNSSEQLFLVRLEAPGQAEHRLSYFFDLPEWNGSGLKRYGGYDVLPF